MQLPLLEAKYQVLETLEDNGRVAVFLGRHRQLGELCVLKVRPHRLDDGELRQRFDARLPQLTRFKHPFLAAVYDVWVDGAMAVLEMEYVRGCSVEDLLSEVSERQTGAAMPLPLALELGEQMVSAVEYLHGAGWHHGSLSLARFVLADDAPEGADTPEGGDAAASSIRLQLIDPGFSHLVGSPERTTAGGLLMQRLRYSPPERFLGDEAEPTAAGDLYVLGLMLYELFTGYYPIAGDQPTSVAAGHLLRPPMDFERSDPDGRLCAELRHVLLRCLAKAPAARLSSAGELRRVLANSRGDQPASERQVIDLLLGERSGSTSKASTSQAWVTRGVTHEVRRARVRDLVNEARLAAERRDYTEARRLLRKGQKLAPEDAHVGGVLRDVEKAAREQQRDAKRSRQLDEAAAEIESLLAMGNPEQAADRLQQASLQLGASDRLRALQTRIDATLQRRASSVPADQRAEADQRVEADQLVERARRQSQAESFDQALDSLREALDLSPDHAAARTLSESVAALADMSRREESQQGTLETTTRVIRQHLDIGDPGAAMSQLNRAVARYGDRKDLQDLRFEIAQAFLRDDRESMRGPGASPYPPAPVSEAEPPGATGPPPPPPPIALPIPSSVPASQPDGASPKSGLNSPVAASVAETPLSPAEPAATPVGRHASGHPAKSPAADPSELGAAARAVSPSPPVAGLGATPVAAADVELAGWGADDEVDEVIVGSAAVPVPTEPPIWLDLRRVRTWVLILVLMLLVAWLGRWLALRNIAPARDGKPTIETEDVQPATPSTPETTSPETSSHGPRF